MYQQIERKNVLSHFLAKTNLHWKIQKTCSKIGQSLQQYYSLQFKPMNCMYLGLWRRKRIGPTYSWAHWTQLEIAVTQSSGEFTFCMVLQVSQLISHGPDLLHCAEPNIIFPRSPSTHRGIQSFCLFVCLIYAVHRLK